MPYIAAFDAGTTAVKGVLTHPGGQAAVSCSVDIPTLYNGPYKEQDPAAWWAAFQAVCRQLLRDADPADIAAVVMSGQMQDLILLDKNLTPVCPAILYSDGRAGDQARQLEETVGAEQYLHITGNRCDGSLPLPKLMWLKAERPELYAKTAHVLISSKDYLIAKLTGVCCGDVTACSTAGAMDIRQKRWDDALLSAAGIPSSLLPPLYAPHQQVGVVLSTADHGLLPGTPVFAGIGDAGATTLASGISQPGQYNINLGTSGWVAAVSQDVLLTEAGVFNLAAAKEGCYINVVPFLNAGGVHKWIAGVLGDYASTSALLAGSVPGSHGLLCLPYLAGERFPVLDAAATGCYLGLTPETSAADLARAALEGVAFSLRQGLEQLRAAPASISLIGGGGRETVWCQILADVLGHDIAVFQETEFFASQALSAVALLGLGQIADHDSVLSAAGGHALYTPRPETRQLYDGLYGRYKKLYPALRGL